MGVVTEADKTRINANAFNDANGSPAATEKVQKFKDIDQNVTIPLTAQGKVQQAIQAFQRAAAIFGYKEQQDEQEQTEDVSAAAKFVAFAQALQAARTGESQGTKCYRLFGMIDGLKDKAEEFKNAAGDGPSDNDGFLQKAGEFSSNPDAEKFKAAAHYFISQHKQGWLIKLQMIIRIAR